MTEEDAEQLRLLNEAVDAAIAARTAWLDERMPRYAEYPIGEMLYDLDTGRQLGTVSKYYRYWAGQNCLHDRGLDIDYKLRCSENIYDNTSRYAGRIRIGSKEQLKQRFAALRGAK